MKKIPYQGNLGSEFVYKDLNAAYKPNLRDHPKPFLLRLHLDSKIASIGQILNDGLKATIFNHNSFHRVGYKFLISNIFWAILHYYSKKKLYFRYNFHFLLDIS